MVFQCVTVSVCEWVGSFQTCAESEPRDRGEQDGAEYGAEYTGQMHFGEHGSTERAKHAGTTLECISSSR